MPVATCFYFLLYFQSVFYFQRVLIDFSKLTFPRRALCFLLDKMEADCRLFCRFVFTFYDSHCYAASVNILALSPVSLQYQIVFVLLTYFFLEHSGSAKRQCSLFCTH